MTVDKKAVSAVFPRPFRLPGREGTFAPGEYAIEVVGTAPAAGASDPSGPGVMVRLQPQAPGSGPAQSLTVPIADLEAALAELRPSGPPQPPVPLDELLADPMVRLFMASDGVTDDQIRGLYAGRSAQAG